MPDLNSAVVCVATNRSGYIRGLRRLRESLNNHSPNITQLFWENILPGKSPIHKEAPYAFKYFAIDDARKQGYNQVLF